MNYFLQQFAQKTQITPLKSNFLGTMTFTKTTEGQDQDKEQELFSLGTMTGTESIEGSDQDRENQIFMNVDDRTTYKKSYILGTATGTKTLENPDQDLQGDFFII